MLFCRISTVPDDLLTLVDIMPFTQSHGCKIKTATSQLLTLCKTLKDMMCKHVSYSMEILTISN